MLQNRPTAFILHQNTVQTEPLFFIIKRNQRLFRKMDNQPLITEHDKHRRRFMCKTTGIIACVLTLLTLGITFGVLVENEEIEDHNHWDILGMTINWPESSCREINRTNHQFVLLTIFLKKISGATNHQPSTAGRFMACGQTGTMARGLSIATNMKSSTHSRFRI